MRIAVGLEYDGSGFCGWQSQPSGCGVQDHLQKAIREVAGHSVTVHAAGRTDAGVHAMSQVAHFDVTVERPMTAWVRGVNAFLPAGARVQWAQLVSDEFHARFSAHQRSYQYLLINRPVAPAIMAGKAGWFHLPLDAEAMREAASYLLGEHDFSAFRAAECQAKSPVKTLQRAEVRRAGDTILFEFSANAFLHHQVRNMVGALVYIGKGSYSPEWMKSLLAERNRTLAPPTFAPGGLYLVGVGYDEAFGLPNCQRRLTDLLMPIG
ncbi:MAG: tRNA pseudouridine(38-40) synthase TruA [Methylophilaceae bacterium]